MLDTLKEDPNDILPEEEPEVGVILLKIFSKNVSGLWIIKGTPKIPIILSIFN